MPGALVQGKLAVQGNGLARIPAEVTLVFVLFNTMGGQFRIAPVAGGAGGGVGQPQVAVLGDAGQLNRNCWSGCLLQGPGITFRYALTCQSSSNSPPCFLFMQAFFFLNAHVVLRLFTPFLVIEGRGGGLAVFTCFTRVLNGAHNSPAWRPSPSGNGPGKNSRTCLVKMGWTLAWVNGVPPGHSYLGSRTRSRVEWPFSLKGGV